MTWIQTYTKRKFDLLNPRPEMVCIEDIAHSLANITRYNGHCEKFYSVGQHSVYVSQICKPENAFKGLMHDAPEAYYHDIATPMKQALDQAGAWKGVKRLMLRIDHVVFRHFGIAKTGYWEFVDKIMPDDVKEADLRMLATEKRDLMDGLGQRLEWPAFSNGYGDPVEDLIIIPWTPEETKKRFMERFEELTK